MTRQEQGGTSTGGGLARDRATWAAYLLLGLFAYLETAVGPSMPFLRRGLDLSYTVASLHFTAFAAGGVAAGLTAERALGAGWRPLGGNRRDDGRWRSARDQPACFRHDRRGLRHGRLWHTVPGDQ